MRGFFICAMQALKVMRLPCKQEKTLQVRRVAPDHVSSLLETAATSAKALDGMVALFLDDLALLGRFSQCAVNGIGC